MAPLGDRSANRQSRIPTKSASHDNLYGSRINSENTPPTPNISRLLVPTKSSVARSKSPSPIPLPIVPSRTVTTADASSRGHLHKALSTNTLVTSTSRPLPERQAPSSPVVEALKVDKPDSPSLPPRNPVRPGRSDSPMEVLKGPQGRAICTPVLPPQKPLPGDKPLPSRPTTTFVSSTSPSEEPSSIIDATEQPLIRSPGTSKAEEWPALTPERLSVRSSATLSIKRQSSTRLPRTSVQSLSSPSAQSIVSPIVSQPSAKVQSPQPSSAVPSPIATHETTNTQTGLPVDDLVDTYPARTSSLQNMDDAEVGLGIMTENSMSDLAENLEHKHMPAPSSFSQPRIRYPSRSPSSMVRVPVPSSDEPASEPQPRNFNRPTSKLELEKRPISTIMESPQSHSPSAEDILTFAGRRLGSPNDFATLDQGKDSAEKPVQRKVQLSLKDLPLRMAPPADTNKLSPMRYIFGDKGLSADQEDGSEYSRIKQLSKSLLSSSFAGSTLSISNHADQLILGSSANQASSEMPLSEQTTPLRGEFDLPSPSSNGFHVSWPSDFGFMISDQQGAPSPTVQSSPSIRNESMGFPRGIPSIQEEAEYAEGVLATMSENKSLRPPTEDFSKDRSSNVTVNLQEQINTTLSILEGTPVKQSAETDYFNQVCRKGKDEPKDVNKQPSIMDRPAPLSLSAKPLNTRLSDGKLPKAIPSDRSDSPAFAKNDRLPSYMLPTPASEARRQSTVPADVRRGTTAKGQTLGPDSRPGSRAARATTPTAETRCNSRTPTPDNRSNRTSGRVTPATEVPRSGTSGRVTPSTEARKSSKGLLPKSSMPILKDQAPTAASLNKRTSLPSLKTTKHVSIGQTTTNASRPTSPVKSNLKTPRHSRTESRGKTVLDNLKGIFSSRRDAPPVPDVPGVPSVPASRGRRFSLSSRKSISVEQPDVPDVPSVPRHRSKSITRSILSKRDKDDDAQSTKGDKSKADSPAIPQKSRRKSLAKSISSRKDIDPEDDERPTTLGKSAKDEKRRTVALMEMGLTMREEAYKEDDLVRKERMASFAQVMLDTVTNAVEAERNMYAAMQAAEQAKMSYMMTQESVHEMSRLVSTSRRLPLFKKKKQKP